MDPFRKKIHYTESAPERCVLTLLIAMSDVMEIREQVRVPFILEGIRREHFLDVVVRMRDGRIIAFAVKATEADLRRGDTIAILEAIAAQHGAAVAHEYRGVSRESLDPIALDNARVILRCGRDPDARGRRIVGDLLSTLGPSVTLREIALASRMGVRGLRAAVALIQSGLLAPPRGSRLAQDLPLANRAAKVADPRGPSREPPPWGG